jgi:hypothetical protein
MLHTFVVTFPRRGNCDGNTLRSLLVPCVLCAEEVQYPIAQPSFRDSVAPDSTPVTGSRATAS